MNTNLKQETVVVLGAHPDLGRYSNRAVAMLNAAGHRVIPIGTRKGEVQGMTIINDPSDVTESEIDTITLYINPTIQEKYEDLILSWNPKRVIFNPGTENPALANKLRDAGIYTESACTLVLLTTGSFSDYPEV